MQLSIDELKKLEPPDALMSIFVKEYPSDAVIPCQNLLDLLADQDQPDIAKWVIKHASATPDKEQRPGFGAFCIKNVQLTSSLMRAEETIT